MSKSQSYFYTITIFLLILTTSLIGAPEWTTYTTANGLASNNVRSIAIDSSGNIWFGTFDGGASKFDGTTFTSYNLANSNLGSNQINAVTTSPTGSVFFGAMGAGCESPFR